MSPVPVACPPQSWAASASSRASRASRASSARSSAPPRAGPTSPRPASRPRTGCRPQAAWPAHAPPGRANRAPRGRAAPAPPTSPRPLSLASAAATSRRPWRPRSGVSSADRSRKAALLAQPPRPRARPADRSSSRGDLLVRTGRRLGQVPGSPVRVLLRIADRGQRLVNAPAGDRRAPRSRRSTASAGAGTEDRACQGHQPFDGGSSAAPDRCPAGRPPARPSPGHQAGRRPATSNSV